MRKELKLSQEAFAEKIFVSVSTLYRIENNKASLDVAQYMNILRALNKPVDDCFLLFASSQECQEYRQYAEDLALLVHGKYNRFIQRRGNESTPLNRNPYVQQVVAFCKIRQRVCGGQSQITFCNADLEALYQAIHMTIPDFCPDHVAHYLLSTHEIYIICDIAAALSSNRQHESAVKLATALHHNKTVRAIRTQDPGEYIVHYVHAHLVLRCLDAKMYSEALSHALKLISTCVKQNALASLGAYQSFVAMGYQFLGEDNRHCQTFFTRAHYWAAIQGACLLSIYKDASSKDGITF